MAPTPTIIFVNLPPKTFIGINLCSFNSSPNFHGITNLSPGLHFVYTGTDDSLSIRHGRWLNVLPYHEIHVLQWNNELEHLDVLNSKTATAQNIIKRLPELRKRGLVDYNALRDASTKQAASQAASHNIEDVGDDAEDQHQEDPWPKLTSHITSRLLNRVLSAGTADWVLTSISCAPGDTEHIPGLSSNEIASVLEETQSLNLLPIDLKQTWSQTAVGRERTDMARDRSWYLSHLIKELRRHSASNAAVGETTELSQQDAARELLGELQFTFLMVLCLANYSCLEQWKRILTVLLTCRSALLEVEGFFVEVIRLLRLQVGRVEDVEGGLFEMADEMGSKWLRQLLRGFRSVVEEVVEDAAGPHGEKGKGVEKGKQVKEVFNELERWLRERYGWEDEKNMLRRGMVQLEDGEMVELRMDGADEEDEMGEYAPVVVET